MSSNAAWPSGYPANKWSAAAGNGLGGWSGLAAGAAELFFVTADFGGEGFEAFAELVDLDREPGEGEGVAFALMMFLDYGS